MGLHRAHRQVSGFTLTELLAVMSIAALLLAVGVPSYRSVRNASRVSTEVNGLLGDLQFTRSEALKQGQTVTACVSTTTTSCSGTSKWHDGWIVFSDSNGNATVDANETVLRVQKGFKGGDTVSAGSTLDAVTFNRDGFALNLPNAGVLLTLRDSTSNKAAIRCLSIGVAGMMSTMKNASAPTVCK